MSGLFPSTIGHWRTHVVFAVIALLPATTWGTEASSSFELHAATSALIGSPFEIMGTARYPQNFSLSLDLESKTTGPFTITAIQLAEAHAADGVKTQDVRLQVVPFNLGPQTFPPLSWSLSGTDIPQILKSPPIKMTVYAPSSAQGGGDIRDIKPPLKPVLWPFILLFLALIASAGYLYARFKPRRTLASLAAEPVDTRPAHEVALDALEELQGLNLLPKPYYDRLTDILRVYLERRFDIPATVLTTSDLIRQMRQAEIDRAVIGRTKELFDRSDLVKFAKFLPESTDMAQDRETAVDIVDSTRPLPITTTPMTDRPQNSRTPS